MISRPIAAVSLALGLCGLGPGALLAQTAPAAADGSGADGPASYQDHFIDGGKLAPDVSAGDTTSDSAGDQLARSLQVDSVLSALSSSDGGAPSSGIEKGVSVKSQWDTAGWGAWSLDASGYTGGGGPGGAQSPSGELFTLRERAMPFDGGWQADATLGDLNAPDIALARQQPRFFLPTAPLQGASTEWRGPDGLQFVAGAGDPGLYDGIAVPGFQTLGGQTATAGAQWSPSGNWTFGGQFVDARGVNLSAGPLLETGATVNSTTSLLTTAWHDQNARVQFNLLDGGISGTGNSLGEWVDGSWTEGRVSQAAGLFRIDPNLTWGNQLISNDVQGGYYRYGYQAPRWIADFGIDEAHSVSSIGSSTTYLTSDGRYQVSRDWGVGGVANVSQTNGGSAWSAESYIDHASTWGSSRVQADLAATPTGRDASFTLDQAWSKIAGLRLDTQVGMARITGAPINNVLQNSTVLTLGMNGGGQITSRIGVQGNVQWNRAVSGVAAPGTATNVSLTWQVAAQWQLLATVYDSRIGSWIPPVVASPLAPPGSNVIPAVQERGVFLTLRYQRASGSRFAPLGGMPGSGAGDISGSVYLDANANGKFDAGEVGAANVTVVLDGRFSLRTDANGRFDFPAVAAGHHVITVISDNLPLPWAMLNEGRTEVDVGTRSHTEVYLGAQRSH